MRRLALCVALAIMAVACNRAPDPAKTASTNAPTVADELRKFDRDVVAVLEVKSTAKLGTLEEAALKRGSTLAAPASLDDIRALERRIGRRLPPSYREFLATSNGMIFHGALNVTSMLPASAVEPLSTANYPSLDPWLTMSDVAVAVDAKAGGPLPGPALAHAWVISSVDDGDVYLLMPDFVRPDGEWPVWFFGSKNPGAVAYPSFAAMLASEGRRGLAELKDR